MVEFFSFYFPVKRELPLALSVQKLMINLHENVNVENLKCVLFNTLCYLFFRLLMQTSFSWRNTVLLYLKAKFALSFWFSVVKLSIIILRRKPSIKKEKCCRIINPIFIAILCLMRNDNPEKFYLGIYSCWLYLYKCYMMVSKK